MKLIYITGAFPARSETFVSDLALGLANRNIDLTMVCARKNSGHLEFASHFRIEEVGYYDTRQWLNRVCRRLAHITAGDSFIEKECFRKHRYAHRKFAKWLSGREFDVAYIDFGTIATLAYRALSESGIPYIIHLHGADITTAISSSYYRKELDHAFEGAAAIVCASHHIRRLAILEGAPPEKCVVIRLGYDLCGVEPLSWNKRKTLSPSLVFLGRLTPKKNPIALVESFKLVLKAHPTTKLTIIGDGDEMTRVEDRINYLNLGKQIRLQGALPRKQALEIVNQHWIYVQHSVTSDKGDQEGFGVSLAEAAALGLSVVSTLHNGIPEQVIDGKSGILVPEYNFEKMAEAISYLLENPLACKELGEYGQRHIQELCSTSERVSQLSDLLESNRKQ